MIINNEDENGNEDDNENENENEYKKYKRRLSLTWHGGWRSWSEHTAQ